MREFGSIVGGQQREAAEWLDVQNPHTGECVGRVASMSPAAVEDVLRQTQRDLWTALVRRTGMEGRRGIDLDCRRS